MLKRTPHYLNVSFIVGLLFLVAHAKDPTPIVAQGSQVGSGWDLSTLNDASKPGTGEGFVFPETMAEVRLYLIDTAIETSSGWFDSNPVLGLSESQLIRGSQDPTKSSAFGHGTQVLSIIAGPEAGVAQGTRIEVVSFDIYPQGEDSASSVALLATAIGEAINHQIENPDLPALICIANGSGVRASSPLLESRVAEAVGRGMPVIVAAGNESSSASDYIPAAYGTMDGVICVGAIAPGNVALSTSNFGPAVDLHAPGEGIPSFDPKSPSSGQSALMSGTSPATGIVAGLALAELGRQPELSPSQLESLMKDSAYSPTDDESLLIVQQDNDFDNDGAVDELERLFGYDPLDGTDTPPAISLACGGDFTSVGMTISDELLDSDQPTTLSDGSTWRLLCSTDFVNWGEVEGYIHVGTSESGRTSINVVDATNYEYTEDAPLPTEPIYSVVDFKDNGEPIVELINPLELAESSLLSGSGELPTLIQQPVSRKQCFYRVEWIPARLSAQ